MYIIFTQYKQYDKVTPFWKIVFMYLLLFDVQVFLKNGWRNVNDTLLQIERDHLVHLPPFCFSVKMFQICFMCCIETGLIYYPCYLNALLANPPHTKQLSQRDCDGSICQF